MGGREGGRGSEREGVRVRERGRGSEREWEEGVRGREGDKESERTIYLIISFCIDLGLFQATTPFLPLPFNSLVIPPSQE